MAMFLKSKGSYIARQLSYAGVKFSIERIFLSPSFVRMYDEAANLVRLKDIHELDLEPLYM